MKYKYAQCCPTCDVRFPQWPRSGSRWENTNVIIVASVSFTRGKQEAGSGGGGWEGGGGRGEVGGRGGEPKLELAGSQSAQPGTGRQYRTGPAPPALVKSLLLCFETRDPPGDFTYLCSTAPCKWRSSPWRTKYRKIYGRWMNIIWMKAMICFIILWDNAMWNVSAPSLHGCSPTGFCAN